MIPFEVYPGFKRAYKKRIAHSSKLQLRVKERITLFQTNPHSPLLNDHPLKGNKVGYRAFSVTGDIRIIYFMERGIAYLVDIGSHNQVYK